MHTRMPAMLPCSTAPAPQAGRYRVRALLSSVGTNGKPLPVMCSCRASYGRDDNDVRLVRDVPADKPLNSDERVRLKARQGDRLQRLERLPSGRISQIGQRCRWMNTRAPP